MYLDPAFGGMLLQVLVAIAAVGGAIIFSFRRKIRSFFKKDGDTQVKRSKRISTDSDDDMVDALSDDDNPQ